jgi:hypothetical protein
MKKNTWMFALLGICLTLSVNAFAEPPEKRGGTWQKAKVNSVGCFSSLNGGIISSGGEENFPKVWFGNWGENGKYRLSFWAENMNFEIEKAIDLLLDCKGKIIVTIFQENAYSKELHKMPPKIKNLLTRLFKLPHMLSL